MTTPSQLANRSLLTSRQPAPKYHSIFGLLIFFSSETRNSFHSLNVSPNISFQHWLISQTCRNGVPAKTTWRFWVRDTLDSSTDRFIQGLSIFLPPFSAHQFLKRNSESFSSRVTTSSSSARNILASSTDWFIQGLSIFLYPFSES